MKLFIRSIVFFIAIAVLAPFASAQTLYWVGGTTATQPQPAKSVGVITPATDMDFNTAANWSTIAPNTLTSAQQTGPQVVPGAGNIAVVDADVNNGTVTDGFIFFGNNIVPQPVIINQTKQSNTVQGFIVSNYYLDTNNGVVTFNNNSNGAFTINGTNVSSGDFLVDGGTTFNYNGSQAPAFAVTNGLIVIGDNTFTNLGATAGTGTFNINSGSFTFDTASGSTSMLVGDSQTGTNNNNTFGNATGTVVQGVTGSSSSATLGSSLILGFNGGTGTWQVTNGSVLRTGTLASAYSISLGSNGGPGGTLNGTGASGTLMIGTAASAGVAATAGTFNLGTTGLSTPTELQLGTLDPSSTVTQGGRGTLTEYAGTVNMAGKATSVQVGNLGGGTGVVNLVGGTMNIGVNATDVVTFTLGASVGSTGTFNQSGGTLNVGPSSGANGTVFRVGQIGTGVYNMNGGIANFNTAINLGTNGTLNLNNGVINISAANFAPGAPGQGILNFGSSNVPGSTGGTINFTSGTTFNDTYAGGAIAAGSTATFNASVGTFTAVTIGQNLTGGGGLTLVGTDGHNGTASTLFTFTGANTYTGPTTISGGTLTTSVANIADSVSLNILSNANPVAFGGISVGTLNLNLANGGLAYTGAIAGNGNLDIKYNTAGDTFAVQNTANFSGNVILGAANGAASGPAGNFQIYSGNYGNISEGTAHETVTIGGDLPAGINNAFVVPTSGGVTFGNVTYTGLTTINSSFSLNVTGAGGLLGDVSNAGILATPSIGGDVTTNSGVINVTGAAGIVGNVGSTTANTGTISAMTIGGNLNNGSGGLFVNTGAVNTTTVGGSVTNGGILESLAGLPAPGNSTFTIGGSLTQSSTGTLVVRVSGIAGNASHDFYQTGGGSTLDGNIMVTGSTTVGNSTFIYITPGATFDPTLTLTSSALLKAAFTGGTPGDSITLTQLPIATYALTPNQTSVANALDSANNPLSANYFNLIPTAAQAQSLIPQALDQLSPQSLQYARNIAFENSNFLVQRMNGVDSDLRSGYGGLDTSAISLANPGFETGLGRSLSNLFASDAPFHTSAPNGVNYYPGGAPGGPASEVSPAESPAASAPESTWSPSSQVISDSPNPYLANQNPSGPEAPKMNEFIGGDAVLADLNQDQSAENAPATKARYTAADITAGVGFRIASHLTAGVLFDYNHTDAKTDAYGSRTRVDTYAPGLFATYSEKGFYANGLFSFGYNDYSNARALPFIGPSTTANSSPNGQQYVGALNGGYDFHPAKSWIVGPSAGLTYTHLDIDSFSETGAPGADLDVHSQSADSLRSQLGGHVVFQTNTGDVLLQPNITALWQHEFLANSSGITSTFNDFASNSFTIQTAAPSRDSALIGVGLTATLNTSMALYLNYLADVGASDYFAQSVYGGLKARF